MNKDKFKAVLDAAKKIDKKLFKMESWCGCIIGHAGSAAGIAIDYDEVSGQYTASYNGSSGYGAVADCLEIPLADVISLFSNASYPAFCNLDVVLGRLERYWEGHKDDRENRAD